MLLIVTTTSPLMLCATIVTLLAVVCAGVFFVLFGKHNKNDVYKYGLIGSGIISVIGLVLMFLLRFGVI
ncbi:hypothetical protein M5361_13810 [Ligilactobacillus agilis]|nr:hypothetical protein [Ligilactobacillus agilis]